MAGGNGFFDKLKTGLLAVAASVAVVAGAYGMVKFKEDTTFKSLPAATQHQIEKAKEQLPKSTISKNVDQLLIAANQIGFATESIETIKKFAKEIGRPNDLSLFMPMGQGVWMSTDGQVVMSLGSGMFLSINGNDSVDVIKYHVRKAEENLVKAEDALSKVDRAIINTKDFYKQIEAIRAVLNQVNTALKSTGLNIK